MSAVKNVESCWKYSIFGRNSLILKVLAHEKRDEIKFFLKIFSFHGMMKGLLIILSQYERCAKCRGFLEIFNFWSKFLNFKGVSHEKSDEIQFFFFKIFSFHGMR